MNSALYELLKRFRSVASSGAKEGIPLLQRYDAEHLRQPMRMRHDAQRTL